MSFEQENQNEIPLNDQLYRLDETNKDGSQKGYRPAYFQAARMANAAADQASAEKKAAKDGKTAAPNPLLQANAGLTQDIANNPNQILDMQQKAREAPPGKRKEWQAKRERFERMVAIRATKNDKVEGAVDEMCQKAVSYILKMNEGRAAQEAALAGLGKTKYGDPASMQDVMKMLKSGSIREKMMLLGTFQETVGAKMLEEGGPEQVKKALEAADAEKKGVDPASAAATEGGAAGGAGGAGPAAGTAAKDEMKMEDIFGPAKEGKSFAEFGMDDQKRLADRAAATKTEAEKAGKTADAKAMFSPLKRESRPDAADVGAKNHSSYAKAKSEDHDTKLPALSVAAIQAQAQGPGASEAIKELAPLAKDQGGGMTRGAEGSALTKSQKTLGEFADIQGGTEEQNEYRLELSEMERAKAEKQAAEAGLSKDQATMPWIEGQKANILDTEADFIKGAKEKAMPLKSGISGTTFRFMQTADCLGVDPDAARMACVGMLQPIEAHSFHEIATAAAGFGGKGGGYDGSVPYTEKTMAPLTQGELDEIARDAGFAGGLAEANAIPPEDRAAPVAGAGGPGAAADEGGGGGAGAGPPTPPGGAA